MTDQAHLIKTIKAHIAKGDQAKDKADQHYIAAGQHLKTLKAEHNGSWAEWEKTLRERVGIGKSRASELMMIADGRKTVERVQEETTERSRQHRESSPLRNGEDAPAPPILLEAPTDDDEDDPGVEAEIDKRSLRTAFLLRAGTAREFAVYSGPVTRETVDAARQTAAAWDSLAQRMTKEI